MHQVSRKGLTSGEGDCGSNRMESQLKASEALVYGTLWCSSGRRPRNLKVQDIIQEVQSSQLRCNRTQ